MHRTIGYISKQIVHLRPGEGKKVIYSFLYFFLTITAYYLVKPVSRSLVLEGLGSRLVPYADLVCAIVMGPIVAVFARLVDSVSKTRLVTGSFWTVIAIMVAFWGLLRLDQPWVSALFYIWIAIFSVLVVTLFWLVANDIYRTRDAKRLFGFIGSGGILGGITGSSVAALGAQVIGSEYLLLISALLLAGCWLIVQQLWQFAPDHAEAESAPDKKPRRSGRDSAGGVLRIIMKSRYLFLLVAIVGLNKIASTLIYYQFNPFIEQTFIGVDAKTTFTGFFFGTINVVAFVVQFALTSWILRRRGLLTALLILPTVLLGGSFAFVLVPIFWIAAGTELFDRALNYSLQNSAKEVVYLPIDRTIRYKVKPFIDMVVFRFGKGIAAVIGIVMMDLLGASTRTLGFIILPMVALWLVLTFRLRAEYTKAIRKVLQKRPVPRPIRKTEQTSPVGWVQELAQIRREGLLVNRSFNHKINMAQALIGDAAPDPHANELIMRLMKYEHLQDLDPKVEKHIELSMLKQVIQDQKTDVSLRRQAIRMLGSMGGQEAFDYLCGMMIVEPDSILRYEGGHILAKLRMESRKLQIPAAQIRRQIQREVGGYKRTVMVAQVYRQHQPDAKMADDPVLGMLKLLTHESIEHIFRLLMLVYRPEDIQLIYRQMQSEDVYIRADAIELLDNLVDYQMRTVLLPILDEDQYLSNIEDEPEVDPATALNDQVLKEAIWEDDWWLSVTTLCAVGRLRIQSMQGELERAVEHTVPLIATAARVAVRMGRKAA